MEKDSKQLEARLSEIEGVLFGMTQAVALLIQSHPNQEVLLAAAAEAAEAFEGEALNTGFDDFALRQAGETFRRLFSLPRQT